jgi:hypothetical protein
MNLEKSRTPASLVIFPNRNFVDSNRPDANRGIRCRLVVALALGFAFLVSLSSTQAASMVASGANNVVVSIYDELPNGMLIPLLNSSSPVNPPLQSNGNGLEFNLIDVVPGGMNPLALGGFQAAANYWSSQFVDDITVNIEIGFSALDPGVLGQAGSSDGTLSYTGFRNAIIADATTADDAVAAANLPGGPSLDIYLNRTSNSPNGSGSPTPFVDNDGDINNTTIRMSTANAKALGVLAHNDPGLDAAITFSTLFTWDFDPNNGIDALKQDFVGVAIHEIGHAMGFTSGVDILDINSPGTGGPFPDDAFIYVKSLDVFRMSDDSETAGADIDWTADTRDKYFSIDGGTTNLTPGLGGGFSTGKTHGDGQQASHWKDNKSLGIMDPTAQPAGFVNVVTALDLQALDVIGWTPVPEPSSAVLFLMATVMSCGVRVRRRR